MMKDIVIQRILTLDSGYSRKQLSRLDINTLNMIHRDVETCKVARTEISTKEELIESIGNEATDIDKLNMTKLTT